MEQCPVCLSIGGSDSCSGAGIQADLQVFAELGMQGCSAITALTAQNPREITRIEGVPLAQLDAELHAVFDYYDVAAVKTGMLLDAEHIAVAAAALQQAHVGRPLVVDPVMVASSGRRLLDISGVEALRKGLLPLATLLTPNLDEAACLLNRPVRDAQADCRELVDLCGCAVLLKGGHASGDALQDILCDESGNIANIEHPRLAWDESRAHGSGCRLAAAIAAGLAANRNMEDAARQAVSFCSRKE